MLMPLCFFPDLTSCSLHVTIVPTLDSHIVYFDIVSNWPGVHFVSTSIAVRSHFDFTFMLCRVHFECTSTPRRNHSGDQLTRTTDCDRSLVFSNCSLSQGIGIPIYRHLFLCKKQNKTKQEIRPSEDMPLPWSRFRFENTKLI